MFVCERCFDISSHRGNSHCYQFTSHSLMALFGFVFILKKGILHRCNSALQKHLSSQLSQKHGHQNYAQYRSHLCSIYSVLLTTTFFERSLKATSHCITHMITQTIKKPPDPFQKPLFSTNFPVGIYCILSSSVYDLADVCKML